MIFMKISQWKNRLNPGIRKTIVMLEAMVLGCRKTCIIGFVSN
jgi:hypothetical protein